MATYQQQETFTDITVTSVSNGFALNLYKEMMTINNNNIFFSPISILTALSMTYGGCRTNTKLEIEDVLNLGSLADEPLHIALKSLNTALFDASKEYTLKSANRIYTRDGYTFLKDFLDLTQNYYNAIIKPMDFAGKPDACRIEINQWVEDQTDKKIQNLLPEGSVDPMTAMVLVNAIYFKGDWKSKFNAENTKSGTPFYISKTEKTEVEMMYQKGNFPYAEHQVLPCSVLELPYVGDHMSMIILLPFEENSLADIEPNLTPENLQELIQTGMRKQKIEVYIPKFKLEESYKLHEILPNMGMDDLFTTGNADLSGMDGTYQLHVSQAVHKAFVDVNEEGTEAAAATAHVVMLRSVPMPPPVFKADRPFLFFIKDNQEGTVLFMGRFQKPPPKVSSAQVKEEL